VKPFEAAILREDFSAFAQRAFREDRGQPLGRQPYVRYFCHELTKFIDFRTTRLLVNTPPQHLKSTLASVDLPAYLLGHNPKLRIILTAYNDALAEDLCQKIRELMNSAWYKQVFATRIKAGHSRRNDFATEENGGVYAVSATGAVTGRPADVVINDDPHEIKDWKNERKLALVRDNVNTLLSRLSNKVSGRIIVVAHRISPHDLSAMLLEEPGWTCVRRFARIVESPNEVATTLSPASVATWCAFLHAGPRRSQVS
jgi:hypothetical protein